MTGDDNSYYALIERIREKAPAYLDLLTARTDDEFEVAFATILDGAIRQLETNKAGFARLNEVSLSKIIAGFLTIPGLTVTQESHSNGHVDLRIEADHCYPARIKLAEAKIYDGAAYHIKGLEQLVGRYTTGRESDGLIISYFRKKNISELVAKLRERLNEELPLSQMDACSDHRIRWSFLTVHLHSCGEGLRVLHVGCNLYVGE